MSVITDELERLIARHETNMRESLERDGINNKAWLHQARADAVTEALMLVRSIERRQEVEYMNKESRT